MSYRVFVVDDEKLISDTLSAILCLHGYDAHAFYDAQSALAACEKLTPEIVISDVMMPGMNGIEMAVQIRERFPQCRILLFSGQSSTQGFLEAARIDGYVFEYLTKPVHPKDILARLETTVPRQSNSAAEASRA
jgi:DNA-binding response OmpR family regulator